jgi:hypothetical protein
MVAVHQVVAGDEMFRAHSSFARLWWETNGASVLLLIVPLHETEGIDR